MDDSIILSNCQKDKIQHSYNKGMRTFLFVMLLKFGLFDFYHTAMAETNHDVICIVLLFPKLNPINEF